MNSPAAELHITDFSNYLFQPNAEWSTFDVGDLVRFRKQVGLISRNIVYRIDEVIWQDADNYRIRLSYYGRPRTPLIIDRFDVHAAEMRHL